MAHPTLAISSLFGLVAAGIYAYVGWRLRQRVVASVDARLAWRSFRVWWFGLAGTTLATALLSLLAALQVTNLTLFVAVTYINLLVICVALWGLLYYLVYLFTGNQKWLLPLTIFYIAYAGLLVYYITVSSPTAVQIGRWSASLVYRVPLTGPIVGVVLVLLVVPQIIGAVAYFALSFRATGATQRYRIGLVSWSIIIWFGSSLAASAAGLSQYDWWQIASRIIGLGAALAILAAYVPPTWLKRKYGLLAIGDEAET